MSLFVENPTLAGIFLVGNLKAPEASPQRLIEAGICNRLLAARLGAAASRQYIAADFLADRRV
jgi:hypothetical protein